jgi:F-box-like
MWLHIFSFVPPRDLLLGCSAVNAHFRRLAADQHLWKGFTRMACINEHTLGWYIVQRRQRDERLSWLEMYRCCCARSCVIRTVELSAAGRRYLHQLTAPSMRAPLRLLQAEDCPLPLDPLLRGLLCAYELVRDPLSLVLGVASHFIRSTATQTSDRSRLLVSNSVCNRLLLFYLKPRCERFLATLAQNVSRVVKALPRQHALRTHGHSPSRSSCRQSSRRSSHKLSTFFPGRAWRVC